MARISYKKWEIRGETIRAYGGEDKEYIHYCPIADFKKIVSALVEVVERDGNVSSVDIFEKMRGKKMIRGRIFDKRTQEYKVRIAFDILSREGLVVQKGTKEYHRNRRGRNPYAHVLRVPKEELVEWLSKLR